MRRSVATAAAVLMGLLSLTPGAATAARRTDSGSDRARSDSARTELARSELAQRAALSAGIPVGPKTAPGARPAGPNPYLALLADPTKADYRGWTKYLGQQAARRAKTKAQQRAITAPPATVDENELPGTRGNNESPASAQLIRGFGTNPTDFHKARVLGTLNPEQAVAVQIPATAEDDGSIPLAGATGIGRGRNGVVIGARIGDGPHGASGTGTGDFDFYAVPVTAGQTVVVATDTFAGALDPVVVLYDAAGNVLAVNDDFNGLDSQITYTTRAAGTVYAMVTGFGATPRSPFDPASGTGAGSEGFYQVTISAVQADQDFYAVNLRAGDVLGATVTGAAKYLTIYDTDPREVHGSSQDATAVYPISSPLPGGGNATTDYVATTSGWHYVGVTTGSGAYDITVEAYRPPLEGAPPTQAIFLDFDGARVNTSVFGGPGVVSLSPFATFLTKWGISTVDEDTLIDAIVARVTENLKQDLIDSGLNNSFSLRVLNSRDNPDAFGQPNVTRVIVGGTIDQSGVDTIGISQSIDPGNFETEETALVLLDTLSGPAGGAASLNTYLTPASNRIRFVSQAVGNVISHEAGHMLGNWHVDQFDGQPNLMDQGGNFPVLFGVGRDGVGGTRDDPDVDFGDDDFNPGEGFIGIEDTLGRPLFGATS